MTFLPIFMLFLFSMAGYSNAAYCVCNTAMSDAVLQKNIDYACGAGADCGQISQNGACFNPNTVKDHCNFAVNSYYQKKGQVDGSCVFSGTASVVQTPPSGANSACFSGNPSTSTPAPPGTGTPGAGTPPGTGTPPGSGTPGTGTPPGSGTPGTGTPPGSGTPGTGTPPGSGTPGTGTPPGSGTPGTGTPGSGTPGTGTPGSGTPGTGTPGSGTPGSGTPGMGTGGTGINVNPPIGLAPAGTGFGDTSDCVCIHDHQIRSLLSAPTLLVSGLIWFLRM